MLMQLDLSITAIIKALIIAQHFIVVRLLFPVHQITAPYKQKYTSFRLVIELVSGIYAHNCTAYYKYI